MLNTLKNLLSSESTTANAEQELNIDTVAAALVFEVIRADGEITDTEILSLTQILENDFKINKEEIEATLSAAQQMGKKTISLQHLTSKINKQWSHHERQDLLVQLWRIAMADDHIESHERHIIRRIAGLLYLTEAQIYSAKERAKEF